MAVSKEINSNHLLHRWQVRMQENVWNFNQLLDDSFSKTFEGVYVQPEREVIAHSLVTAYRTAKRYLGYAPQPEYTVDKIIYLDQNVSYFDQEITVGQAYVNAFGTRATSLIEADATPVITDVEEGDSVNDTATFTITTSVTDENELQLFYRVTDGAPSTAHEQWRIPTESISISGGTATVVVHLANLASPSVWLTPYTSSEERNSGDRTTDYVAAVDVYRVYTDTTDAVRVLTRPTNSSDTTVNETTASPVLLDPLEGRFYVKNATGTSLTGAPYAVKVSYNAGKPLNAMNLMDHELEQAIIRLCNVDLSLNHGPMSHRTANIYKEDLEPLFDRDTRFEEAQMFSNPLGKKQGHYQAWLAIRRNADPVYGLAL